MATSKEDRTAIKRAEGETEVSAVIAAMPEADRLVGERLHTIIKASAPELLPRTWYGMPAYTNGDKIICFFRSRQKFGERFMTLGFNDTAKLDDGNMWPIYFAIQDITDTEKDKIAALIRKAVAP
jgi:hypothetical protein